MVSKVLKTKHSMKFLVALVAMFTIGSIAAIGGPGVGEANGKLDAPQGLTGTSGDSGITLTWTAPEGSISGYRIYRKKPNECERTLTVYVRNTGSTATTYVDDDVVPGVKYVYRVKAISDTGVAGKRSNFVKVRKQGANRADSGAPRYPRNLDANMTREGMELLWDAPNGGPEVTGYQILRRRPAECEAAFRVLVANTNSTETAYYDTTTEVGTRYVYRVKAVNSNGVGRWSNYVRVTGSVAKEAISIFGAKSIMSGSDTEMDIGISHLKKDGDASTVDYILRGDVIQITDGNVTDVDACEGSNLGTDISITVVDEHVETFIARFGGSGCTEEGDYTVRLVLLKGDRSEVMTMDAEYRVEGAETLVVD